MIKGKNICKKFSKQVIFDNLNFEFSKGLIIINGESGSGKTTLLNLLSSLDTDYDGELFFQNKNYRTIFDKEKFRYRNFGFVYQNYHLFNSLTVKENLSFLNVGDAEISDVLSLCGLYVSLNQEAGSLSGGEKQRLAIARAILSHPKVLLCDEPTGALDYDNSLAIMKLLKKISEEHLVIMISHDEDLSRKFASELYKLQDYKLKLVFKNDSPSKIINSSKKENKLSFSYMITYIKRHLLKKKIRSLLTIFASSLGLIFISLSLILTSLTVNDIISSLGSLYDEERILLKSQNDDSLNEIYSVSKEEVELIKSQYQNNFLLTGSYYFQSFETLLDESYLKILSTSYPLTMASFSVRNINEYYLYQDVDVSFRNLENDEVILMLRNTDIKRICDSLRIENNLLTLNEVLKDNPLKLGYFFKNSSWDYQDEITLFCPYIIKGNESGLVHSSGYFNEYVFEGKMHFKSSDDLVSSEPIPWTLKKVYYLKCRENNTIGLLKRLLMDKNLNDYRFDIINSLYDSRLNRGEDNGKIYVYYESKKDLSLADINTFLSDEKISKYSLNIPQTYQMVNEFALSGFALPTYLFTKEEDYIALADDYYITENNIIYESPEFDNVSYSSGSLGKLGNNDNLQVINYFNPLIGRIPDNYQEVAISSALAKKLFSAKSLDEIINQSLYFSTLLMTYYDGVSYENHFAYQQLLITGITDNDYECIYLPEYFNVFFYIDNFDIPLSSLIIDSVNLFIKNANVSNYLNNLQNKYPNYYFSNPSEEINDSINSMIKYVNIALVSFGGVIVVSAILLSGLTMFLFISENKKEIGLFKAIGIKKSNILFLYFMFTASLFFIAFIYSAGAVLFLTLVLERKLDFIFSPSYLKVYGLSLSVTFLISLFETFLISSITAKRIKNYSPLTLLKEKS